MTERGYEPERLASVFAAVSADANDTERSLGGVAAAIVGVKSAGVLLMSANRNIGNVSASDPVTEEIEELQYTLGNGPCVEAYRTRQPVLSPDLVRQRDVAWPEFRAGVVDMGVRRAFGFPLRVESVCIGALNLYDDRPGDLTDDQFADAIAVAHVATRTVMSWQAHAVPGTLAIQLEQVPAHRAVVHQATGMVSVQAEVSVEDAQVLIRAYAFAESCQISDVASDLVDGRLRFD